jgi:hypothetical protein
MARSRERPNFHSIESIIQMLENMRQNPRYLGLSKQAYNQLIAALEITLVKFPDQEEITTLFEGLSSMVTVKQDDPRFTNAFEGYLKKLKDAFRKLKKDLMPTVNSLLKVIADK